jgi:hypothetical protein
LLKKDEVAFVTFKLITESIASKNCLKRASEGLLPVTKYIPWSKIGADHYHD